MRISIFYFKLLIILLFVPAIFTAFFPGKIVVVTALCLYPILFFLLRHFRHLNKDEFDDKNIINIYIAVNIIIFIRGLFDLKSSQDIIVFFSGTIFLSLLYPLFIFLSQRKYLIQLYKSLIVVAIPLSFITFFFKPTDGFMSFQHNMSFIYLFIFVIPFVKWKWKFIILVLTIVTPLFDITRRSSLINIIVCVLILFMYYIVPHIVYKKIIKSFFVLLVIAPLIFIVLGLSGVYNIFTLGDKFDEVTITSNTNERNLLVDSRTGIYIDVFSELSRQNAYIWGLGGVGKTKTSLTDNQNADYDKIYKEGRRGTESGMLNYFQLSGFIGALSFWLLLTLGAYKAIFKSNNSYYLMLGLFVAFKVLYSFVEDSLNPNIATFYLMIMIGLCYNFRLRNLREIEIKKIFNLIFK